MSGSAERKIAGEMVKRALQWATRRLPRGGLPALLVLPALILLLTGTAGLGGWAGGQALAQTPAAQTPAAQTPAAQTPAAQIPAVPLSASGEIAISRNLFHSRAQRPRRQLSAGAPVQVREEIWTVSGVSSLRIRSPDPKLAAVLRFRPLPSKEAGGAPAGGGELRLTVILLAWDGLRRFQTKSQSRAIVDGEYTPLRHFWAEEGLVTALAGSPGRVREIAIQDDGEAEIRLSRAEGELLLEAVTPEFEGQPYGGRPYYYGKPLLFADYTLLTAAGTDNVYGEALFARLIAFKLDAFFSIGNITYLGRGVVTTQAWRSESLSLWAEGGAAVYQIDLPGEETGNVTITFSGGVTVHYRTGSLGAAAHFALAGEDQTVLLVSGNWQVFQSVGAMLAFHSFGGASGTALGAAFNF